VLAAELEPTEGAVTLTDSQLKEIILAGIPVQRGAETGNTSMAIDEIGHHLHINPMRIHMHHESRPASEVMAIIYR
jgi:hypothetical protein